jgi:hypothetical protein
MFRIASQQLFKIAQTVPKTQGIVSGRLRIENVGAQDVAQMRAGWTIRSVMALAALISASQLFAGDAVVPPAESAPLSTDRVVDNLVRRNQERAQALLHSEATRAYRVVYRGFPSDRVAEMTVEATYNRPSSKQFTIISQSGSKLIANRVFKKLLESEKEAAQSAMSAKTQLNRDNYNFAFVGYEPSNTGGQYILRVYPKLRSKYVYRGLVWVDGADFAVTRIEAEPAENPSFWTKKSQIHQEYGKVQGFWLPLKNESVSYIRLGGRATLTIEYTDYRVQALQPNAATPSTQAAIQ